MFKDRAECDQCSMCRSKKEPLNNIGCCKHSYCKPCCDRLSSQHEASLCILCLRIEVNNSYEMKMIDSLVDGSDMVNLQDNVGKLIIISDVSTDEGKVYDSNDVHVEEKDQVPQPSSPSIDHSAHNSSSIENVINPFESSSGEVDNFEDWANENEIVLTHSPELAILCASRSSCSDIEDKDGWSGQPCEIIDEREELDSMCAEVGGVEGPMDDDFYQWPVLADVNSQTPLHVVTDPFWDNY